MSSVVHIPAPSELTQAHRDAMAYVQELAITISQQGMYAVSVEYVGHIHGFSAHVLRFSEIAKGNFKADQALRTALPGRISWVGSNALDELQAMARELEALLIPPFGGNAA
ncbi:hypothetical protein KV699_02205 [Vreelandella titanicae]|uniref:hypothetical protein n=1 Tax=Vreelandella titanicae TaxID=664683 RepID=UPI003BB104AE